MDSPLFRQEASDAKRDRLTGTVVAATPPRSGLYVLLAVGALAAFLAIAVFGQFTSRVPVAGRITYDGGFARVYPPSLAEVRSVHVRNGQEVRKGQPLVTLAITQGRDRQGEGVASQLARLAERDRELLRQQQLSGDLGADEQRGLQQQRANLTASIASLRRQQQLSARLAVIAQGEAARAQRLLRADAGSRREVDQANAASVTRQNEREQLNERLIAQQDTLRAVDTQLAQRPMTTARTLSEIAAQRADLAAQRAALLRLDRIVLTAPIDGRVGDLLAEIGQRARPEASLLTVVPSDSRLAARLYTPTRAIGFVRKGERLRLLFDAYPYEKYGAGIGRVTDVAQVAVDPAALDEGMQADQPLFRITVAIERGAIAPDGTEYRLTPGMTLTSNLQLERRPIWEVLLSPLLRGVRS